MSAAVLDLSDRESITSKLLRDCYDDINSVCSDVQLSIDEAMGLHLKPQKANYPAERVQQFSHSLIDPTVKDSVIKRRVRAGSETITKSFHDDFIKKNAQFRTDVGLKCYIIRIGTKCCDWCTEVAGKYEMGDQPDGIFRRHDNCDCTIIYYGQVLRGKQNANGSRSKTWEELPNVNAADYTPPSLSEEQGRAIEQRNLAQIRGLKINNSSIDNSSGNGIMSVVAEVASNAHSRDVELESIIERCIKQDKPVFADDLALNFSKIPHESGRYIVAMHGSPNEVMLYGRSANEKILANIIRSRKDYNNEDEIVLISCNTGNEAEVSKCFAQRLADEMGKTVYAPTRYGAIDFWGNYYSSDEKGRRREGDFIPFEPKKGG